MSISGFGWAGRGIVRDEYFTLLVWVRCSVQVDPTGRGEMGEIGKVNT
jgi:hypothetical protein